MQRTTLKAPFGWVGGKSRRKPKDLYKSYDKWSRRLKGVTIENKSFSGIIYFLKVKGKRKDTIL